METRKAVVWFHTAFSALLTGGVACRSGNYFRITPTTLQATNHTHTHRCGVFLMGWWAMEDTVFEDWWVHLLAAGYVLFSTELTEQLRDSWEIERTSVLPLYVVCITGLHLSPHMVLYMKSCFYPVSRREFIHKKRVKRKLALQEHEAC